MLKVKKLSRERMGALPLSFPLGSLHPKTTPLQPLMAHRASGLHILFFWDTVLLYTLSLLYLLSLQEKALQ